MTTTGRMPQADVEQRHLAAIVDSSDDAIISKDRDAIIRSWNPGAERLYGWSADEAVGRPISILIPPNRAGEERRILDRIVAGERVHHYETERVRRDGRTIWVSLTISPVRDDAGEVVAASVIARDVTARRESERERERLLAAAEAARAAAERSRARLAFLARASETLGESLDARPSLARLARLFVEDLASRCAIHVLDGDRLVAAALAERGPDGARVVEPVRGDPVPALVGGALGGRDARLRADVAEELVWPGGARAERVAALIVPVRLHGDDLGALTLVAPAGTRFAGDDVALAEEVARRTASAIENWRAYAAEHAAAVTLQRTLLPRALPEVPGIACAARYMPAGPDISVGGDWYDVFAGREGRVVGVIGDVAGRGLDAAATMGQLRNALRAYALDGHPPAGLVERVNRLAQRLDQPDMATLALVVVAPALGEARLVLAGHPPPLALRADGRVERLAGQAGPPIGAAPHSTYAEVAHALEPGTTLLLYTDGLVERRGEPLARRLARLEGALADAPDDIEELCDHVVERMDDGEAARADDVALLALRLLPVDVDAFAFRRVADVGAPAALRAELRRWLAAGPGDPRALHELVTACSEAAANVVEHAYATHAGPIEVTARRDGAGHVEVVVRDFGRWRPERETGGGRGLGVIRALVDEIRVDAGAEGTAIAMRRRLAAVDDA